ncbi:MAG: hypothetical protein R2699_06470 [Acidimicrobiales bacterium]
MDRREALGVLGLDDSADAVAVRRLQARIAVAHPDVAGADATGAAARLTQAYAVLQRVPADAPGDASPMPDRPPPPPPPPVTWTDDEVDATLRLDAVGPEAFALLGRRRHRSATSPTSIGTCTCSRSWCASTAGRRARSS